jgi:hypothetical protein
MTRYLIPPTMRPVRTSTALTSARQMPQPRMRSMYHAESTPASMHHLGSFQGVGLAAAAAVSDASAGPTQAAGGGRPDHTGESHRSGEVAPTPDR